MMSDTEPRAMTADEVRKRFIDHIRFVVRYWSAQDGQSVEDRVSGVAFSILSLIDGSSAGLPAFDLVARPHPDDAEYHREEGENWVADGTVITDGVMLHELFFRR